ncbi:SAGA HAT/Core module component [Mortierella hygrophila]|uniref:SAGA HAT/Core module component n=1 Tax=Mortierella hygrophila TaxID=979708 RepID=A0A9P6F7F0_9FUNG|nr:SAGA HAT/Core module component [Mortierella hygrophila]
MADRKNHRLGAGTPAGLSGSVTNGGTTAGGLAATAAVGATATRILSMDDPLDEFAVWKNIQVELQRLADIRDRSDDIILNLDKVPEGLRCVKKRLKKPEKNESKIIQRALEGVNILITLRDSDANADNSPEGKRKKRKIEAEGLISNSKKIRRYSAADTNGIIPVGHQVAARTPKDKNKVEEWILARVLSYSSEKKYVVEDDEADDYGKKMTYTLSARSVIMIMDDQEAVPEFPTGHTVLALYPSTTCFYKAIVVRPPSKDSGHSIPLYTIKFDDDEGNERTAPPKMVLDMPKLK